jgi:hypothetical protein
MGKIKLIFKGVKNFIEKEIRTSERKGFWQSLQQPKESYGSNPGFRTF